MMRWTKEWGEVGRGRPRPRSAHPSSRNSKASYAAGKWNSRTGVFQKERACRCGLRVRTQGLKPSTLGEGLTRPWIRGRLDAALEGGSSTAMFARLFHAAF